MTTLMLGVTLGALSLGALHAPVVPRWTAWLGLIGAPLLLTGGLFSVDLIGGGPALFVPFGGFAIWLLWLTIASLRIVRATE